MTNEPNRMFTQDNPGIFFGELVKKLNEPDAVIFDWPRISDADSGIAPMVSQLNVAGMPTWKNLRAAPIYFANPIGLGTATLDFGEEMPTEGLRMDTTITPGTGSITIDSELPIQIRVWDNISVTANPESSGIDVESQVTPQSDVDWVERLSWALPKQLREQIFGDLCEIRARMEDEGCSRREIAWKTSSQLLLSSLWWFWTRIGWIAAIWNRLTDWPWLNK